MKNAGLEILFLSLLLLFTLLNLPLVRLGFHIRWQGGKWKVEMEPRWVSRLLRFLRLLRPGQATRTPGGKPSPPHPEPAEPLLFALFPALRPLGERLGLLPDPAPEEKPPPPGASLLLSLLRRRLGTELQGWVKVGTGDAAATALLAGALSSFSPRLRVMPHFLGQAFEGEVACIFRLTPGQIIREGWQIWSIRSRGS